MDDLITGYRIWRATVDGELTSVYMKETVWPVGEILKAECTAPISTYPNPRWPVVVNAGAHEGRCPHVATSPRPCGIHAFKTFEAASQYMRMQMSTGHQHYTYSIPMGNPNPPPHYMYVMGVVALGGKFQEHEMGWRAEFALPLALYEGIDVVSVVADRYGVPTISREVKR